MSRPMFPWHFEMKARRATGPVRAALGLLLALLPAVALPADPQQEKPADKRPPASAATAGKTATKKDAPPVRPATAALRFTDEDLERYHKPKAAEPEGGLDEEADVEEPTHGAVPKAAAPTAPPKVSPAKPSPPKPRPALVRAPPKAAKLPAEDPLKPWKDREALETFRNEQIGSLRDRIAALQSRLGHLDQKRLAIIDPLRVMPQPQSAEEGAQDAERGPRDLLEAVENEIESVKTDLDQAKQDLIVVETRFAQETATR